VARATTNRDFGASAELAVLAALTTLTLILPNFVISAPGPVFSTSQLAFEGVVSLVLYSGFIFVQTVRHRDYFLPMEHKDDENAHAKPPSNRTALLSAGLLLVSLVAVVGLAKSLTPVLETGVRLLDIPKGLVGVVIAGLVLMPESLAALRAARANRLHPA
jgi:Ca2+:H+ antiporter